MTGSWASQSICRSGFEPAQLAGDRDVALGVAEPDRRGDEEGAGAAVGAVDGGVARRALAPEGVLGEVAQRQVDLDRLAGVREVTGAADHLEPPVAEAGQRAAVARRGDLVAVAVDHQHRAVQVPRQLAQACARSRWISPGAVAISVSRVGVERPAHAVLDAPWSSAAREGSAR